MLCPQQADCFSPESKSRSRRHSKKIFHLNRAVAFLVPIQQAFEHGPVEVQLRVFAQFAIREESGAKHRIHGMRIERPWHGGDIASLGPYLLDSQ